MIPELCISIIILYITVVLFRKYKSSERFPPGPAGFPVLGHLPLLGRFPHKTLMKWRSSYGPIIGLRFGSFRTVAINEAKLIREAMNLNSLCGKPTLTAFTARSNGILQGVLMRNDYHEWKEQRRFVEKNLRTFGLGTKSMEAKIMEEVQEFVQEIKLDTNRSHRSKGTFHSTVIGALWSIMFNERMNREDSQMLKIMEHVSSMVENTRIISALCIFLPRLAKMFPQISGYNSMKKDSALINNFIRERIANHNLKYDSNKQSRDFVDAYTKQMEQTTDENSTFHPKHKEIIFTVQDLFTAGTDTVSTLIQWFFAYMFNYPAVLKFLREELDRVIGTVRLPALTDKDLMPYMEAVTMEIFRHSSLATFPFHNCTQDMEFHGYSIPKNTMIIFNLYSCYHDPELWGDPENFRPERFLDANGQYQKNENVIPFGVGKRGCLGESLARNEIFLILTSLLQAFSFSPSNGKKPSLEGINGMTVSPPPFDITFTLR